ncbi:hypothetical protein GCM10029964_031950 [Kibdelosporangium lantanae]
MAVHDDTIPIPKVKAEPEKPAQHGHGHGHHHGPAEPASAKVRRLLTALLVPFALASVVGVVLLYPFHGTPQPPAPVTAVAGEVTSVAAGRARTAMSRWAPVGRVW